MNELVIATRESPLALWQAKHVQAALEAAHPGLTVSLLGMKTQGDKWLSSPLSEVGGKGLFLKELEQALLEGRAHLAVHSMKDVPAHLPDGFVLPVIAYRDDVRDAFVSRAGTRLADLPAGSRIGSASLRRQCQLRALRPDLEVAPIRGNVGTRLGKMESGEYDALVLASAGLRRLELEHLVTEHLDVDRSVPSAGQGALGIECLAAADDVRELIAVLDDPDVRACVETERRVTAGLAADCSAPLGAYAVLDSGSLSLSAVLGTPDGTRLLRARASGAEPDAVGAAVVAELERQGARDILDALDLG
ncbi:MAG: hydroxymethylbilane synthase [Gammaproteobacteria bacterium]|nr:hydroxymethylbilane synthase [Gammaproteobacteria bacterium]MBK82144.1 hydroxymethylbilane synthase [Gammaproteobacteria bacterium]